ncbi:4'-phosphopantetheinyl transferase [Photobacterium sp. TLY01]|uniref:4'-phosphopantetheinyl transferase family protein n=1 Tax=Photobacterium sp. TLY01 TaxID=2907534 RepID=UPI001F3C9A8F|nr:4'-phosphopantetheinyl transferase superfamily protein [Photobacterium sp. TLY01]UIP27367.1 4'-phosphopantetheinyl transferase superfamily protein [Photobacterium sp. TLY01]
MTPQSAFVQSLRSFPLPECSAEVLLAEFDLCHYSPSLFSQLGVNMPATLSRAVPKRQAEFLAGRYLAQQLLKKEGIAPVEITIADNRAPVWPQGLTGSISHHEQLAACVICPQHHEMAGVGLDIELPVTADTATGMPGVVVNDQELVRLDINEQNQIELMTLIFSAKESIFKALYPQVQRYFDFLDVSFVGRDEQWLHFALNTELAGALPCGRQGKVYYSSIGQSVLTFTRSEYFTDNNYHY